MMEITSCVVLKANPEDFQVTEVAFHYQAATAPGRYSILQVLKRGFTTFEALDEVARWFGVNRTDVRHAGLKDEDGITSQYVSVLGPLLNGTTMEVRSGERWVVATVICAASHPVSVGGHLGNAFRTTLRHCPAGIATRLEHAQAVPFAFVNYYDVQRFGTPGEVPTNHKIGEALLNGDWDGALSLLRSVQTSEGREAGAWRGAPKDFLQSMQPSVKAFYLSAYESGEWNRRLSERICISHPKYIRQQSLGGGLPPLAFVVNQRTLIELLSAQLRIPLAKYRADANGQVTRVDSEREGASLTQIRCIEKLPEEGGTFACTLEFFLPPGIYATMLLRQLVGTYAAAVSPRETVAPTETSVS